MKKAILILLSLALCTCTKEQVTSRLYPRIETGNVVNITSDGAVFQGKIIFMTGGISDHGFLWSMSETPVISNSDTVSMGTVLGQESFSLTLKKNLIQGQKYFVRAYAKTANYLVYGNIVSFISQGSVIPLSITSVSPSQHLMPGDTVTLIGENFGSDLQIKLGGKILKTNSVFWITDSSLKFKLPDTLSKTNSLSIIRFGQEAIAPQKLVTALSLKNKGNLYMQRSANCVIGTKDYFGFGYTSTISNSLFSFEPSSNSLVSINQSTISPRAFPIAFSINGIGYFGGGVSNNIIGNYYSAYTDFYSINPATNLITRIGDLPIPSGGLTGINHAITAFTIGDKGYCLTYTLSPTEKNELYEFSSSSNQWTKKADFPGSIRKIGNPPFSFALNGLGYIGGGFSASYFAEINDFWSYDPNLDAWTPLKFNLTLSNFATLNANGTIYLINTKFDLVSSSYNSLFYEFIPSTREFKTSPFSTKIPLDLNGAFSVGNSGFLLSGSSIWEFDPSM